MYSNRYSYFSERWFLKFNKLWMLISLWILIQWWKKFLDVSNPYFDLVKFKIFNLDSFCHLKVKKIVWLIWKGVLSKLLAWLPYLDYLINNGKLYFFFFHFHTYYDHEWKMIQILKECESKWVSKVRKNAGCWGFKFGNYEGKLWNTSEI